MNPQEALQAHEGLIRALAHRYGCWFSPREDLEQEGRLALLEAVQSYDPDAGTSLGTWIYHCALGRMRHYVRAQRRWQDVQGLPAGDCDEPGEPLPAVLVVPDIAGSIVHRIWLGWVLEAATDRQREAMALVYGEQRLYREAGECMAVGEDAIDRLVRRGLTAARRRL